MRDGSTRTGTKSMGPPAHSRTLLDDVSDVLRSTHDGLQLHTVTAAARTARRDGARETCVRRYGPTICKRAAEQNVVTPDGRLDPTAARAVLGEWLQEMSKPKGRGHNGFELAGFTAQPTELWAVAHSAVAHHAARL